MEDLKDKHRKGRPITEVTQVNIERLRMVIKNDPWCTYNEIEAETALSHGLIHVIIHAFKDEKASIKMGTP